MHPLSPLLRGANLIALAIAAISWQGYRDLGLRGWLVAVGCVVVAVLAYSVISWLFTGYHIVGRELRIYEGWVWRRTRAIPIERLQSVEVVRPLLARAFGLAELRIEVVGAGKTEAPLAYLPVREAGWLRERLLTIARGASGGAAGGRAAVVRPAVVRPAVMRPLEVRRSVLGPAGPRPRAGRPDPSPIPPAPWALQHPSRRRSDASTSWRTGTS